MKVANTVGNPSIDGEQMEAMEEIAATCDLCKKDIRYGSAVVEVCRNVYQIDNEGSPLAPDGVITMIDSEPVITLCASCGNSLQVNKVAQAIKRIVGI